MKTLRAIQPVMSYLEISKLLMLGLLGILTANAWAQQVVPLAHRWEADPGFGDVWTIVREPRAKYLDLEDLRSDQAIVRFEAAQNICLNYDRPGFRNPEKALKLLIEQLSKDTNSIHIRRSMISGACLLDDGSNAQTIWQAAKSDPVSASMVESFLIQWKSPIAKELWRERLADPKSTAWDLEKALDGLAIVGEEQDRSRCRDTLGSNRSTPIIRLAAARALGKLQTTGLLGLADEVLVSTDPDKHLLAANLIAQHDEQGTLKRLETILDQGPSPAQRVAAGSIARSFPDQGLALASNWAKHPDDVIRLAALNLLRSKPSEANTRLQATLLADPDAKVRKTARLQLLEIANNGLRPVVDECISEKLASEAWQGIEQAIVLAVELQDRSRCPTFLKLLDHPRAEVNMHAGWGLMELADDPTIIASMAPIAMEFTAELEAGKRFSKQDFIRQSFLFEAFGKNRYAPVVDMLRKYIPKDDFKMGNLTRASAIWALGKILKDQDDPQLRTQLRERIFDLGTMNPENYLVGYACILALGEFGFLDSMGPVERHAIESRDALSCAGRWAKAQIEKTAK